ncbi:hypothetical protein SISNIDRAFT_181253 [Sistotremastrum niveocremeum HHB9708]|uniref:Uncharacterized protein n=1 Tax=Sistotremastrum niveocremeum HHB9708 TaxID=1314777 RepID=A0A164RF27_9AGAM|nr:hypothetical protein SISNIDRAFT_181253 [Sistotremastrum niveocremeum HHB9708]
MQSRSFLRRADFKGLERCQKRGDPTVIVSHYPRERAASIKGAAELASSLRRCGSRLWLDGATAILRRIVQPVTKTPPHCLLDILHLRLVPRDENAGTSISISVSWPICLPLLLSSRDIRWSLQVSPRR